MRPSTRRDRRLAAVLATIGVVLAGGALLHAGDPVSTTGPAPLPAPASRAEADAPAPHGDEVRRRFDEAVVMLHARRYDHAVTALHRVLVLAPAMPEAHVNMGFALLGLQRPKEARDFFEGATALAPSQANAYYGLALAWEGTGDLEMARGAMRSYLHLARDEPPRYLARARAALWEWEASAPTPR